MLRTSLLCMFAAVAVGQTNSPASFGSGLSGAGRQIMSGSTTLKSGVAVRYRTVLAPDGDLLGSFRGSGIAVSADVVHRFVIDGARQSYFGYDLAITPSGAPNSYKASFQPLSNMDETLKRFSAAGMSLRPMPLPKYPAPQMVQDGDIIELDLMVSADGKQKLTDYIEILSHMPEPAPATTTAEPRDFTVDDGPVTFHIPLATIWINGQKYQGKWGLTGKPGATFWVALPGQGRYVLSLIPHEGFTRSGTVRDNVISFEDEGQLYEVRFMDPIAGSGKAWNLYMLHDLTYQPPQNQRNSIYGGVDRLENLLPARYTSARN
jgi:hypothetical protein